VKGNDHVEILEQGDHYVVANKAPSVVVHHSSWTGKISDPKRRWKEATPMLQRVRDATKRTVNLVHRLDRGASGCLVFSFADNKEDENGKKSPCRVTKTLIDSMQDPSSTKTYLAFCDGDGTWNGVDFLEKGWFTFDRPVKDEWGKLMEDCRTDIRFIAATVLPPTSDNPENLEGRKICIVLTRPRTGKWHQVRQHLSSGTIGHAILGDSSHGRSRTNRIWKKKRHLMKERTCLHLARVQLTSSDYTPNGIDVSCPLPQDLMKMLNAMPELLKEARPILNEEGVEI
jgi:tRNA pseudouridine65 synthase